VGFLSLRSGAMMYSGMLMSENFLDKVGVLALVVGARWRDELNVFFLMKLILEALDVKGWRHFA
jgi:hypothetical protein